MPAPEKKIHKQTFEQGMNTSLAKEHMPPNQAKRIYSCNIRSTADGDVAIVTNIKGNLIVSSPLPGGQNKVIGVGTDEEETKFVYFIWNEFGYHTLNLFKSTDRSITKVIQSVEDTGGFDILKLDKNYLILHADIDRNNLLYWVDGLNEARKLNISKALDKSAAGYGPVILPEFINAYKLRPEFAPDVSYFSDPEHLVNRMYGSLRKFAYKFIYDDYEKSDYSEYSNVALPPKESYTGINNIPTDNNGIEIVINTGSRIVTAIELVMLYTIDTGLSEWKVIATLNKKNLNIPDNSQYVYKFYNDGVYPAAVKEKVERPYSFLPFKPKCQALVQRAITYAVFKQGFPVVDLDVSLDITYQDLFIDSGVSNEFNKPQLQATAVPDSSDYLGFHDDLTHADGTPGFINKSQDPSRAQIYQIKIGADVKAGNVFNVNISNGSPDNYQFQYKATSTDTNATVGNKLKQQIVATGRVYRKTPELPYTNIDDNTVGGDGSITFKFIMISGKNGNYMGISGTVNPVQFNTLKDTGQSLRNPKLGNTEKYAFVYGDGDGRYSLSYTNDNLIGRTKTINELGGIKIAVTTLTVRHRPPIWAKTWQVVRSGSLTYDNFIQMLIQKVISVQSTDVTEYLDIVVGSLFTYQRIHENTTLAYDFKKGDRIRLIKNTDNDTYYDFYETEILSYKDTVDELIKQNLTTHGNNVVTVDLTSADNIGRIILVDSIEREIVGVNSATEYLVNASIGKPGEAFTYFSYDLVDRRGTIRIRKPSSVTIADLSLVEIYTPSLSGAEDGTRQFLHFNKKFNVLNWGTELRAHGANKQNQDGTSASSLIATPAIVEITEGTVYVRNRELPITNGTPAQVAISDIEDPSFSDFYQSLINDNGRVNTEDTGKGEVFFDSRIRFSNNSIEDTEINGLNDFDNLDRKDYNDIFGGIELLKYRNNRLGIFKTLRDAWTPVYGKIIQDKDGQQLLGTSSDLLGEIMYLAWEGGIGNNPESYASNGTMQYHVSANSGVICRIGGDGITPISEIYDLDNEVKDLLRAATNNKARIFGGFDRHSGCYIVAIEGFPEYLYFDVFNEEKWNLYGDRAPEGSVYEIVTGPAHGTAVLSGGNQIDMTPTANYIGTDSLTYRTLINGVYRVRKLCFRWDDYINRQTAWRQKNPGSCVGSPDGAYGWSTLEQFYTDDNTRTGEEKPNSTDDPDYVAPIIDLVACPMPVTYYNTERTQSFIKNDCASDQEGSSVPYTVAANTYISTISQADADAQAQAEIDANGQNNANTLGTCTTVVFGNTERTQNFTKNDCGVDSTGTIVPYTVSANTFTASSQAAADAMAQAAIDANGQNNANANGTCILNPTVAINFQTIFGSDPLTWNGLIFYKNGAEVGSRITYDSGGVMAFTDVIFRIGDTFNVKNFHYVDNFPWAPSSKANMSVLRNNSSSLFNADNSDPNVVELNDLGSFVITPGTTSIDITATGSSTASGYITKTLNGINNCLAYGDINVEIDDDTTAASVFLGDLQLSPGGASYPYNYQNNADHLTMKLKNNSSTLMTYSLTGEFGFSSSGTIVAGTTLTIPSIPKGSTTLTTSN